MVPPVMATLALGFSHSSYSKHVLKRIPQVSPRASLSLKESKDYAQASSVQSLLYCLYLIEIVLSTSNTYRHMQINVHVNIKMVLTQAKHEGLKNFPYAVH